MHQMSLFRYNNNRISLVVASEISSLFKLKSTIFYLQLFILQKKREAIYTHMMCQLEWSPSKQLGV